MRYPPIIIGAGYGGLFLAAYLARAGYHPLVLEAHSLAAGCASSFKRGPYKFDAGATTLSALLPERPLGRLMAELLPQVKLETILQDPGITIHLEGKVIRRWRDTDAWIAELEKHFPGHQHQEFWQQVTELEAWAYACERSLSVFPPRLDRSFLKLVHTQWRYLKRLPLLWSSLAQILPESYLEDQKLMRLLDELLLISTQSTTERVPALIGVMGLGYPSETYLPLGGMDVLAYHLIDFIKAQGGRVHFKERAELIECEGTSHLVVHSNKALYHASVVAANVTAQTLSQLLAPNIKGVALAQQRKPFKRWGALVANFAFHSEKAIFDCYHQIHFDAEVLIPGLASKALFYSLSHPDDRSRSPAGSQCVSVSAHVDLDLFPKATAHDYERIKTDFLNLALKLFRQHFKGSGLISFKHQSVATPATFARYASRLDGHVGGLPHDISLPLYRFPTGKTKLAGLYQVGDQIYPGQGVVGVASGARNLYNGMRAQLESGSKR